MEHKDKTFGGKRKMQLPKFKKIHFLMKSS